VEKGPKKKIEIFCVPDCPTIDFQMVNNPEYGRCEYLGYYCKYGNAKTGC
jgi:hypothetical protein